MKKKPRILQWALFLLLIFATVGCEKDLYDNLPSQDGNNRHNPNLKIRYLTGNQARQAATRLGNQLKGKIAKRSMQEQNMQTTSGLIIDYNKVIEVENEHQQVFQTYKVTETDNDPLRFKNVVYSNKNGVEKSMVITYEMTPAFAEDFYSEQKTFSEFQGTIQIEPLTDDVVNCCEAIAQFTLQIIGGSNAGGNGTLGSWSVGSGGIDGGTGGVNTSNEVMCPSGHHLYGDPNCWYVQQGYIPVISYRISNTINPPNDVPNPTNNTGSSGGPANTPLCCIEDWAVYVEALEQQNCDELKQLLDIDKGDIKPSINNLATQITPLNAKEYGSVVMRDEQGNYTKSGIPSGQNNFEIPINVNINNLITVIHTHPVNDGYPMFSFGDLVVLKAMNENLESHNQGLATFILVAKKHENDINPVVYAIVLNSGILQTIDNIFNSPKYNGFTQQQIIDIKNEELNDYYEKDPNPERAFLQFINGLNISLYKADATLSNWKELKVSSNSPDATVTSKDCN